MAIAGLRDVVNIPAKKAMVTARLYTSDLAKEAETQVVSQVGRPRQKIELGTDLAVHRPQLADAIWRPKRGLRR